MSYSPPNGDVPDPQDDLESLQIQMNQTTDESLESTRRMMNLCEESKEAGIKTLVMLDEQGEQLDRIDVGMDQINQDMKAAEKNLQGMEKCCGLCVLPWKKGKNFEKDSSYAQTWNKNEDGKVNTDGPRMIVGGEVTTSGGYITKVTNDAREDEMEENLGDVSNMLGNLRNMAIDMGNEIGSQNKQIDKVNSKAQSNEERIVQANKRANKLLKD